MKGDLVQGWRLKGVAEGVPTYPSRSLSSGNCSSYFLNLITYGIGNWSSFAKVEGRDSLGFHGENGGSLGTSGFLSEG